MKYYRFFTINVFNSEGDQTSEYDSKYSQRMRNIVNLINEKYQDNWSIIGLQEGRYSRTGGHLRANHAKEKKIPTNYRSSHTANGSIVLGTTYTPRHFMNCFSFHYPGIQGKAKVKGRTGFVIRYPEFQELKSYNAYVGDTKWGQITPELIGHRLKIEENKYILPVFNIHMTSNKSTDLKISMARDCVKNILKWYVRNDLPPVFIGDFNLTSTEYPEVFEIINEYFMEVRSPNHGETIDKIWIGRPEKFGFTWAQSRMFPVFRNLSVDSDFDDGGIEYSDHSAVTAELFFPETNPVILFWNSSTKDNLTTGADSEQAQYQYLQKGYKRIREDFYVYHKGGPGRVSLMLFFNRQRNDYFLTGTTEGYDSAKAAGYSFIRSEGYVLENAAEGTVPLKLFWHPDRQDSFTTASQKGEQDAINAGYQFVRVEGYVFSERL